VAYATLQELKDAYPAIRWTGTGALGDDKAQAILDNLHAQVDGILKGLGYIVPVTGTESVKILKDIVIQGSIAQVLKTLFYGIKDPEEVGANQAYREFRNKLKALADPDDPLTLSDAQISEAASKVAAELISSYTVEAGDSDTFRPLRDQVF
jgi:hypothetical protein